jgi:hypothetical protein
MALATTVNWDDAKTISRSLNTRNLRDTGEEDFYNLQELIEEIVLEFKGATAAACNTVITANAQPTTTDYDVQSYSYDMRRDDIVTGSYTITRTFTGKTIEFADPP